MWLNTRSLIWSVGRFLWAARRAGQLQRDVGDGRLGQPRRAGLVLHQHRDLGLQLRPRSLSGGQPGLQVGDLRLQLAHLAAQRGELAIVDRLRSRLGRTSRYRRVPAPAADPSSAGPAAIAAPASG